MKDIGKAKTREEILKLHKGALFLLLLMFSLNTGCALKTQELRSFFEKDNPKEIRPMIDVATNEQTYLIIDVSKPKEGEK